MIVTLHSPQVVYKEHTGAMLAFHIPTTSLADALAVGDVPADELHMTLLYMGEAADIPDSTRLVRHITEFAQKMPPIHAHIRGIGRFSATDTSDGKDVLYASVDAPELPQIRYYLWAIAKADGVQLPDDHGFTPHITLAYVEPGAPIPEPIQALRDYPVVFERMYVHLGDDVQWIQLSNDGPKVVLKSTVKEPEDV